MIHFIVNPHARTGQGKLLWESLKVILDQRNISYKVYVTAHRGHAIELARVAAAARTSATDPIVIVGGDGSIGEMLTGLPLDTHPIVGCIPAGSGNDFARGLNRSFDINESLEHILAAKKVSPLDVGELIYDGGKRRCFSVSAGIGYDAAVCDNINHSKTKDFFNLFHMADFAYTLIGLKAAATYQKVNGTLTLDDEKTYSFSDFAFLSCHNTPYEGGGWEFAPDATPFDGELSLCLVAPHTRIKFATGLLASKKQAHGSHEGITLTNCKKAVLHLDAPLAVHVDGEVLGKFSDLEFRVIPAAALLLE